MLASACAACGGSSSGDSGETISIVGFAVPEAANKAIAEEFKKTDEGEGVGFKTSYGASGDQSRAVADGLEADYVHLSVATDVTRLVDADLVDRGLEPGRDQGHRLDLGRGPRCPGGQPQEHPGLGRPGQARRRASSPPNPASSGAARWNALAAWGHVTENGGTEAEATEFVDQAVRQRRRR